MNGPSNGGRRSSAQRPYYGRPPVLDSAMIGNMVQQQVMQALSSMLNANGKRPAQASRGAPGTEGSNGFREKHCFYCGKSDHYIAVCPRKKEDEDKGMLTIGWRPQIAQESSALAIMGGSQATQHGITGLIDSNSAPLPNSSPYAHTNARDIGPQPKMH
ncbi:hypothetical protein EDC01DRAFT_629095 [Geopyxis carbonaria]|nr:hypothetical protein EDC01DRAFT_629095 [Geopyxis carbonaria]